jgi:tripartite-type tricarboxylate transporter receptor subunit TctC
MQRFIPFLLAAALTALVPGAHAQAYPTKAIRVLVPFAPKGVPKTVVDTLYKEVVATLALPDVRSRYATVGAADTIGMPPAEFHARVKRDLETYRKIARQVGIQPQ